jgi:tight adherence protein C
MTLVIITALGFGFGLVGVIKGLRGRKTSLLSALTGLSSESVFLDRQDQAPGQKDPWRFDRRIAVRVAESVQQMGIVERTLGTRLALSNTSLEELVTRCLASATVGLFLPILTWTMLITGGIKLPVLIPLAAGVVLGAGGVMLPIAQLNADAKQGLRLARRALCSFLDLVVLGLAGGMGIESALLAAAELGENVMSRRILAALSRCRDTGEPPWEALARLGETLGVEELAELAATVGLAGMEGARVRGTLVARAATIRRHELANTEAEANALTERLFIPGTLLLVGFLIFIGYPAFTRIASGF